MKTPRLLSVSIALLIFALIANELPIMASGSSTAPEAIFRKKKQKKAEQARKDSTATTPYKKLTGRDSVALEGCMNVFFKDKSWYAEIPMQLMGRDFLVVNRLQKVPRELNGTGLNKGINYESGVISFEYVPGEKAVNIRESRHKPEVNTEDKIAASVRANYIDPILHRMKIESFPSDSSTVVVKIDELFNGKKQELNDVFGSINIGTPPVSGLSRIVGIKAFDDNITATSELTTKVREGFNSVNVTVEVTSSLFLLPETPMRGRLDAPRVGYFGTKALVFSDRQQEVESKKYITRWRLEPADTAAYLAGQLTEPVKPITIYLDGSIPAYLVPYIKQGIEDWNVAFEKAGFRNAIRALEFTDSMEREGNDMKYSVLTYAASLMANAMGPSTCDPRTGEIFEADIIWWHNVLSLIREWLTVQTGTVNPAVRTLEIPDSLIGDAARFVACHEMGHSLGLRHNMMGSWTYPTDSLRSETFTSRVKGTSASIMDYARFNYVAQPGDGVRYMSPHIGPYDLFAIEYGYRWYPDAETEKQGLAHLLNTHRGRLYKYSDAQEARGAIDPRAMSEDLGDDAMKSATYSIKNLKQIVPQIVEWTREKDCVPGTQSYYEASKLYTGVLFQYSLYAYHVLANVGGMYVDYVNVDDGQKSYNFVPKETQRRAVEFLLDEYLEYPAWIFNPEIADYTYFIKRSLEGAYEQSPNVAYKTNVNYLFWDMLDNHRLARMFENEFKNGREKAFTVTELMDILHKRIFASTIRGEKTDIMTRNLQKSFVDALITAAAESEGVKINKHLTEAHPILEAPERCWCPLHGRSLDEARQAARTLSFSSTQINRNSDALSVKRAELIRINNLLKSRKNTADIPTRYHYEDILLRISTALGLPK